MSSTNRGGKRIPNDAYYTPADVTRAIVPKLANTWATIESDGMGNESVVSRPTIIDAGAGTGAITRVLREEIPGANIVAVELVENDELPAIDGVEVIWGDYLSVALPPADLVVMNPPYSAAMPFVLRSLDVADEVAALLRLSWAASSKRRDFHTRVPSDIHVLDRRPSFCWSHTYRIKCTNGHTHELREKVRVGIKADLEFFSSHCEDCEAAVDVKVTTVTSDSCDYAWFVWGLSRGGRWSVL